MAKLKDLTGNRYGRLVVLEFVGRLGGGKVPRSMWRCRCDCGKEVVVAMGNLRSGHTTSCGCFHAERTGAIASKHGDTRGGKRLTLYNVWSGMKSRCYCPSNSCWRWYGARGIGVCHEWMEYEPFREWALSHGYKPGLTIDRIDVDGWYCPENCRWVTQKVQMRNYRGNVLYDLGGAKICQTDYERCLGLYTGALVHMRAKKGHAAAAAYAERRLADRLSFVWDTVLPLLSNAA